jgi:hypothetical protein
MVHFVLFAVLFIFNHAIFARDRDNDMSDIQEKAIKVYLDDMWGMSDYIKKEITYVNYVRDRKDAQVHVILVNQRTGGGGREHNLYLIGQQNFTGVDDTLKYVSLEKDAEEVIRAGIVRTLKIGLLRYVSRTPLINHISVNYQEASDPEKVKDKWNYWLFRIGMNCNISGEESRKRYSLSNRLSANRVTPEWKIQLGFEFYYTESRYNYTDYQYKNISKYHSISGKVVKSLGKHWSIGGIFYGGTSTYSNQKMYLYFTPALEYNIFPYSQSTRREFCFLYRTGCFYNDYNEETLYDKMSEMLYLERLQVALYIKEQWGNVHLAVSGSHFFHDFRKNRLTAQANLEVKLFKGLSLNFGGTGAMVHDQLSLPKRGATEEEVLLQRRELATNFNFYTWCGLSYTFGSIYSNVVNPRFDGMH